MKKNIYLIDDFLIRGGWFLFFLIGFGGCSVLVDGFSTKDRADTSDVQVIQETRGLEDSALEEKLPSQGKDTDTPENSEPFSVFIGMCFLMLGPLSTIGLGHFVRRRESRIIGIWNDIETSPSTSMAALGQEHAATPLFIVEALTAINRKGYRYGLSADQRTIINPQIPSRSMVVNQLCQGCNAPLGTVSSDFRANRVSCPYCSTPNEVDPSAIVRNGVDSAGMTIPGSDYKAGEFSKPVFVMLVFFFWPAAVIYALRANGITGQIRHARAIMKQT